MVAAFPELDLVFIESGGDNLAATFSPELADLTIYVIDVAAGDKIPRKGGPGITRSDLLVINKIDLAPLVGADLGVMDRDAAAHARRAPVRVHQHPRRRGRRGRRRLHHHHGRPHRASNLIATDLRSGDFDLRRCRYVNLDRVQAGMIATIVGEQPAVAGDQRQVLMARLRHQHPIERVAVMDWQVRAFAAAWSSVTGPHSLKPCRSRRSAEAGRMLSLPMACLMADLHAVTMLMQRPTRSDGSPRGDADADRSRPTREIRAYRAGCAGSSPPLVSIVGYRFLRRLDVGFERGEDILRPLVEVAQRSRSCP